MFFLFPKVGHEVPFLRQNNKVTVEGCVVLSLMLLVSQQYDVINDSCTRLIYLLTLSGRVEESTTFSIMLPLNKPSKFHLSPTHCAIELMKDTYTKKQIPVLVSGCGRRMSNRKRAAALSDKRLSSFL